MGMMKEQINGILAIWEAKIGSITKSQRAGWYHVLTHMSLTDGTIASEAVSRVARDYEDAGRVGSKPSLETFERMVGVVKHERGLKTITKQESCSCCDQGIVYMIQAHEKGRWVNVPRYTEAFAGNNITVSMCPCTCAAGTQTQNGWFKFSYDQIRELNEYTYPATIIDNQRVNSYQHAWMWAKRFIDTALSDGQTDNTALTMRNYEMD